MAIFCCAALEDSYKQSTMMNFLFRRDGLQKGNSVSSNSVTKNKLPQASIHFLRKVKSIQGVMEAYASDKKTTFVKLENQRIVCLKGYNANPLYDCLREMYRAQENEQFFSYLQGSRSSGASSSDRPRTTYTIPDYDFGVCCSENVREYVLKKKFPGRVASQSASSKTSLVSASQSSVEHTNAKVPQGGSSSGYMSEKSNKKDTNGMKTSTNTSEKVPALKKALSELQGTEYNNNKYHKASLQQIDEYMRNSFNVDFVNLFTDASAMRSADACNDEEEDIYTLGASHQTLKQYEHLPYKQHFPPLTSYSNESSEEEKVRISRNLEKRKQSLPSKLLSSPAHQSSQRQYSDHTDKIRDSSRKIRSSSLSQSIQRRHTIASPQKKKVKPQFIKVYRPGHSRPIFISGATTLGGLPEPASPVPEKRLSDCLKHKPISSKHKALRQSEPKPVANSCPLICEAGEREELLATGYGKTSSFSESFLTQRHKWGRSEISKDSFQRELRRAADSTAADAPASQYETSLPMEKSLQEANDLVRTLFDHLSIGAPAPKLTVASTNYQGCSGVTSVSPSDTAAATSSPYIINTPCMTTTTTSSALGQYSQTPEQENTESDSFPSASSSDARKTV